ncbi:MAG: aldo/keto reductase [Gemmatimonadaceae bacterium]
MQTHKLGTNGPIVSRVGLGCMAMSDIYGPSNRADSIATIRAAFDAGINLFDTGDFYGMGHNEMLIAEAVRGLPREEFLLSVKFGGLRDPGNALLGFDGRPVAVKNFLAYSLKRLGVDYIDIYRPARLDAGVPIEDTVGAIADMIRAGYVRYAALSEASAETVRRANVVTPIVDLQIEYSIATRGIENNILPAMREFGVGVTAYGVLSRGLLSERASEAATSGGFRGALPRFSGDNFRHNLGIVDTLAEIARSLSMTLPQLAFAWVLSRGEDIVPLIGARRPDRLAEALVALDVKLSETDLQRIEAAMPSGSIVGDRYNAHAMSLLDSERAPATTIR